MADLKISQMSEDTNPPLTDFIPVIPLAGGANYKVKCSNLKVSALNLISAHTLATFTNTAGTTETGLTLVDWYFNWTYNRNSDNPTSQTISPTYGAQAVALRQYHVTGASLTASTTYTMTSVGDDGNPSSLTTTVLFGLKRYWGVSATDVLTGANVMSVLNPQHNEFGTAVSVSKVFDASAGSPPNYLYYAYPAAWGAISSSTFNTFPFTDYSYSNGSSFGHSTPTALTLTNSSGGIANYYIVRTTNTYSGAGLTWVIA